MNKTKILVSILSYGGGNNKFEVENLHGRGYRNQDRFLVQVLNNYNNWDTDKYDITLRIYCTTAEYDVSEFKDIKIDQEVYDETIHVLLCWQHRDWFIENKDNYDYFIFNENDIMISQKSFETYQQVDKDLPGERDIPGLVCWEIAEDGRGYGISSSMTWTNINNPTPIRSMIEHNDDVYIQFSSPQVSSYIIDNKRLNILIGENLYTPSTMDPRNDFKDGNNEWSRKYPDNGFSSAMPSGYLRSQPSCASEIYSKGRFRKLISLKHWENLTAHHMSNDYVNGKNGFICKMCYINEDWFREQKEKYGIK